jgi:hypothetical protein
MTRGQDPGAPVKTAPRATGRGARAPVAMALTALLLVVVGALWIVGRWPADRVPSPPPPTTLAATGDLVLDGPPPAVTLAPEPTPPPAGTAAHEAYFAAVVAGEERGLAAVRAALAAGGPSAVIPGAQSVQQLRTLEAIYAERLARHGRVLAGVRLAGEASGRSTGRGDRSVDR